MRPGEPVVSLRVVWALSPGEPSGITPLMTHRDNVFTEELCGLVVQGLQQRHGHHLVHGERFAVSGATESDAVTITVTFENADRSQHLPVEAALLRADNPRMSDVEARDILVDFVDYYFDRYFKGARQVTLPVDWKVFPFGEHSIRARGWERNLKLEEAADRILAGEPPDSVRELA